MPCVQRLVFEVTYKDAEILIRLSVSMPCVGRLVFEEWLILARWHL